MLLIVYLARIRSFFSSGGLASLARGASQVSHVDLIFSQTVVAYFSRAFSYHLESTSPKCPASSLGSSNSLSSLCQSPAVSSF